MISSIVVLSHKIYLSNPDSSIALANKVLASAIEGNYKILEGYIYYVLSKANWTKSNYRLSTEYGYKALKVLENSSSVSLWSKSLLSLARTFTDLRNFNQGRMFIDRAIKLATECGDSSLHADAYRELSMLLTATKVYDSALYYADKGLAWYEKSKDTLNISILYSRKAKIFFLKKDYRRSMALSRGAIVMDSLVDNQRGLAIAYLTMARNAYLLNKVDSAILLLKKSVTINNEIANLSTLVSVHDLLAEIYFKTGKAALAVEHLKLVNQYKDSLYNSEKNGHIQEMQSLYELEAKDKTIHMLEQENALREHQVKDQQLLMGLLVIGIFLSGALIIVLIRLRKIQTKTNEALSLKNSAIEQQKEEIHAQAENLHELNQLKSKLFSVISHDLRGPIATLHALLELLTNKQMTPEEFLMISDKLKSNLNVTQRTLENLLNWSLSQMEGIKTEKKNFSIQDVIEEACHLMEEVALRKNVTLERNVVQPFDVKADPDQIQLILRNLIHNAIKFSKQQGKVLISVFQHSSTCTVSIKDFGIGMTPYELETLAGSNKHFTKTGTEQEKGTGLGLLLCQEFIKLNGGTITIESKQESGTEVSFTLLLATPR